jgi:tetratricopeptide (TPR) repeat protein
MQEGKRSFYDEDGYEDLVARYEEMLKKKKNQYFELDELETIIDYYIDAAESSKAIEAVNLAERLHPNSSLISLKKSQILINKGLAEEALENLKNIEKIEAFNPDLYLLKGHALCLLGKFSEAEKVFEKALNISIEDKVEVYFSIASIFVDFNQTTKAINYLLKAYNEEPLDKDVLYELAFAYDKIDKYDKSIEYYNKILDIDPFDEHIWYLLGQEYEKLNMFVKAIDCFDNAIAINPRNSIAYLSKSENLFYLEEYDKAIKLTYEYIELFGENSEAYYFIGECYEKKKQYNHALRYYQESLKTDPAFSPAWYAIGMIESYKNNFNKAIHHLKKAIKFEGDNNIYWSALGKVYVKNNMFSEARAAFKHATKIDPYDFESWINLAETFGIYEDYKSAIEIMEKGYHYNRNIAEYNYRICAYYIADNNINLAQKYLENALKISSEGIEELYGYFPFDKLPEKLKLLIQIFKQNEL